MVSVMFMCFSNDKFGPVAKFKLQLTSSVFTLGMLSDVSLALCRVLFG